MGVGLRCQKQGSNLVMNLGFSHQVNIPDTEDCTIAVSYTHLQGMHAGYTAASKKAIVTLTKDSKEIEFFNSMV